MITIHTTTTTTTTKTNNNNNNNRVKRNCSTNASDNFARDVTVVAAAAATTAAAVEVEIAATVLPVTRHCNKNRKLKRHSRRKSRRRWAATSITNMDQPRFHQLTFHPNSSSQQDDHCHNYRPDQHSENYLPSGSKVVPVLTNGTIILIQETPV